ncbi:MAG: UDP-N-acetylglucosamine--N-acetylmuramyl-(pentapeptide) pyrophosphoryl-undecaprenol N-acetylglucosamine transferase [Thermoleophilaceae bacterium]|nr:UDP-N-acetylglucosamine--N-acetylmuramyl-(pentapeptide) pyrophosphoryl-undecaprenol N-acetylglucosamine transferase [Thermoleophilaceae bacterium]
MSPPLRIAIATGGTAGHAVPALAVGDELRARGHDVMFIGGDRAEAELVPAAGFEFHQLRLQGLDRKNPLKALRALGLAARGVVQARKLLRAHKIDVVMAGGGYVAGPVGVAAFLTRTPVVATEADAHLGITNRLLAPFAKRVCLAFVLPGRDGPKYLVTGRPIAPRRVAIAAAEARAQFGLSADGVCLLVFGGSLGARTINRATLDAFSSGVPDGMSVLHLAGKGDFAAATQLLESSPELVLAVSEGRYRLLDFTNDFDTALAAADFAVCRAGGSIFELAASGLPAVLVPYPHATADHQAKNAQWYVDGGAGVVVPDAQLGGTRLRELCDEFLGDPDRLDQYSQAAMRLARPDAAGRIADEVVAAAGAAPPAQKNGE